MKKLILVILAVAVVFIMGSSNALAADQSFMSNGNDIIIVPYWENAKEVRPTILFEEGIYSGYIRGSSDVTKISMTVILSVKNSNGTYSEVSRTSNTSNANVATKSNSYSYVKGKTYKLTVMGQVYIDSTYETVEKSITTTY